MSESPAKGMRLRIIRKSTPPIEQISRKMPPKRKAALRPSIIDSDPESSSSESYTSSSDVPKYKPIKRAKIYEHQSQGTRRSQSIGSFSNPEEPGPSYGDGPPVTSDPVAIIVGEEKEKFFVHTHLLESSSQYLALELSTESNVTELRTIKLLDANANAFRIYAKWLYTGRFHFLSGLSTAAQDNATTIPWDDISACYNLSHALQAQGFSDATIDAFIQVMELRNTAPVDLSKWIYSQTAKDSVHRKLCRDIVVHTWDRKSFDRLWKEDFPREFLEEVFAEVSMQLESGVKRRGIGQFLKSQAACEYHEHQRLSLPCYRVAFGI